MSHAAYVHDIQHVIVDNLQFMLGSNYQVHDRYTVQNQAIAEFRKFASAKNIHVSVVIHPRKVGCVCVSMEEGGGIKKVAASLCASPTLVKLCCACVHCWLVCLDQPLSQKFKNIPRKFAMCTST